MKNTLLIAASLLSISAGAQVRKMPEIGLANQAIFDKDAAAGKFRGFTMVSFLPRNGKMDTSSVFREQFNPSGYVMQSDMYRYDSVVHPLDKEYVAIFGRLHDRYSEDCSRIVYKYDHNNNVVQKQGYDLKPAGSFMALLEGFGNISRLRGGENGEVQTKEEMLKVIDSLKAIGIPEVADRGMFSMFQYNSDDNMVLSRVGSDERHYTYKHHADGRVKVMREVFNRNSPGSPPNMAAAEFHFEYTPSGKIKSMATYRGTNGDTADLADDKLYEKSDMVYDSRGQRVSTLTTIKGMSYHKCFLTIHKDTLPVTEFVIHINKATNKKDTVSITKFSYSKKIKSSAISKYNNGRVYRVERTEIYLDDKGRQYKIREYAKPGSGSEKLVSEDLIFYD